MRKHFIIFTICLLIFAGTFSHCGKSKDEPTNGEGVTHSHEQENDADPGHGEAGHIHEEGEEPPAAGEQYRYIHVKPEIIKQWGIRYASPESRDYVEKILLTGVVKENKSATFIINALVGGIVTGIKKDIGDPVKKGDVLCVLNSSELLELKTDYIKAFQQYRLTKENYRRSEKLFNIKAIEKKELINRESAYKTALAEYFSLEAELDTLCFDKQALQMVKEAVQQDDAEKIRGFLSPYYSIRSPAPGKVMTRDLSLGERIENNKAIFEISDTRKLWVMLDAMEKDLRYIEKEKKITVVSDVYPGEDFPGKVLTLMEKIDPQLRTVKVRVEVENKNGLLKPEMYVRGKIEKKIGKKHLAVPTGALVKVSGVDGIFVIEEGEFAFKAVKVIETDSAGFAFVIGAHPEDMVITEGAFYLKAEYEIQSGSADAHAGHQH